MRINLSERRFISRCEFVADVMRITSQPNEDWGARIDGVTLNWTRVIELCLKAIDRLIELVRIRERRSKNRYDEIYRPSFAELETVHGDYLAMLLEFSTRLSRVPDGATRRNQAARAALECLRKRRIAFAPVRRKLWAFRDLVRSEAMEELPLLDKQFLFSLINYFEATEIIPGGEKTYSSDLLDKLEKALKRKSTNARDDGYEPSYSIEDVRNECDDILDWIGRSWTEVAKDFNKLRFEAARQSS